MTTSLTRTPAAVLISGVLLTAALLTSSPAQAGSGRGSGAMTGAPTVGTCSVMTAAQGNANTDSSTPVPCKQPHTALVAGVVKLPASLDWTASKSDIFGVVAKKCAPEVWQRLGRTAASRDETAYGYFWFEPTKAEKSQGARWLSCSIFLSGGSRLLDLPTNHTPLIPPKRGDGIARCLTKSVATTACDSRHAWRATGTFTLDVATRPSAASLNKTAIRRCLPHVDRHKFYRFTYKDPVTWSVGDHTVVCYTKTST
jgi:hypothetical protein